jgi:hypothetical protein
MKSFLKPIAAAVGLALMSAAAHAQLAAPSQGSAVPASDGLFLEVYNNSTGATEVVNLSYAYTDITGGNLANLNSPQAVYATGVADPTGAADTVSQLDFGTIANASAFSDSTSNYMVVSAATGSQTGTAGIYGVTTTSNTSPSAITLSGTEGAVQAIQQEIAAWASQTGAAGTFFDATGATTASAAGGPMTASGNFSQGTLSPASLDTATDFYNILANSNSSTTAGIQAHHTATSTYAGFFDLSSSGDLTYNIITPVPLPAAVWLFGGGLLGLIGVGRRRAA